MSRGEDTNSWASKRVRSYQHSHDMIEMSLEEAQEKLKLFKELFPRVTEYNHTLEMLIRRLRTGSDRQGEGLQNLQVVGSTPTPCSKDLPPQHDNYCDEPKCLGVCNCRRKDWQPK